MFFSTTALTSGQERIERRHCAIWTIQSRIELNDASVQSAADCFEGEISSIVAGPHPSEPVDRRDDKIWGWIGFLGLAGLAGLIRRDRVNDRDRLGTTPVGKPNTLYLVHARSAWRAEFHSARAIDRDSAAAVRVLPEFFCLLTLLQ